MASPTVGDLLAAHLTGAELLPYAPQSMPARSQDPECQKMLEDFGDPGEL